MFNTTLPHLECPREKRGKGGPCKGSLRLRPKETLPVGDSGEAQEIRSGHLECEQCKGKFPILAGVAVVVPDVRMYVLSHVKGISQVVPDSEIPSEFRREYQEAREEIECEHIEDDLEARRVTSLYLMNHYLRAASAGGDPWWKPRTGKGSPLIDLLVRAHWDQGPFAQIERWITGLKSKHGAMSLVELGCGTGGLCPRLSPALGSYLGVDSSFASIALARHLALGMPYRGSILIPEDLLQGPVSREIPFPLHQARDGRADFIVGDLAEPPLRRGGWDLSVALNTIDMLDQPSDLPDLQNSLLRQGGVAIQSCPYIWHEIVARPLRENLPEGIEDSAGAVEWLYRESGFSLDEVVDHVPWLFFKHVRQLEIYSVHMFTAVKA